MTNLKNHYAIAFMGVTNEIGRYDSQLAASATDRPSPVWMGLKAASGAHQTGGEPLGGQGAELSDIGADGAKLGRRAPRPDYLNQDGGAGFSSEVPHFSSQAQTSSFGMTRPASMSARASAWRRASASSST